MYIAAAEAEERALMRVAELMLASIKTAPKAKGMDNLDACVLTGEEKSRLSDEMRRIGEQNENQTFLRDAECVKDAGAIVLAGTRIAQIGLKLCGICGFRNCEENKAVHGMCCFNLTDLGIAVGSAVSIAADHRVDNRIMYTAGIACVNLGMLKDDISLCLGIPLSISSKNIFFDRKG